MLSYWSVDKKDIIKTQKLQKKNKEKLITLSKRGVCDSKKFRFVKKQEASGL